MDRVNHELAKQIPINPITYGKKRRWLLDRSNYVYGKGTQMIHLKNNQKSPWFMIYPEMTMGGLFGFLVVALRGLFVALRAIEGYSCCRNVQRIHIDLI